MKPSGKSKSTDTSALEEAKGKASESGLGKGKHGKKKGMRLFGRKKKKGDSAVAEAEAPVTEGGSETTNAEEEEVPPTPLSQAVDLDDLDLDALADIPSFDFEEEQKVPDNYSVYGYVQPLKHVTKKWKAKRDMLAYRWNEDYKHVFLATNESDDLVSRHMIAAHHVLGELEYIRRYAADSNFPPSVLQATFETLEQFLRPRVARFNKKVFDGMPPGNAAKLVMFIDCFIKVAKEMFPDFDTSSARWNPETPLKTYLKGVEQDMDSMVEQVAKIYTTEDNIRESKEGHMVSGLPTQVSFLLGQQLAVMTASLPVTYHHLVYNACFEEISRLAGAILQVVKAPEYQEQSGVFQFCALINDSEAVVEVIEEKFEDQQDRNFSDSLCALWTQMCLSAVALLVGRIMDDLHNPEENILVSVGREGASDVGDRIVATFSDYFEDLPRWIANEQYFLPKIFSEAVDRSLHDYLTVFFKNTMQSGVRDAADAAHNIRMDFETLLTYFNKDELISQYHETGGFYADDEVGVKLEILRNIANLVDPNVPPELSQTDVNAVQWSFDATKRGSPTVLHLVGLRARFVRLSVDESAVWLESVATAKRILSEINASGVKIKVGENAMAAPHIRDSRYIHNVQMGHFVRAKLSPWTLETLDSTRELKEEQSGKMVEEWQQKLSSTSKVLSEKLFS